MVQAPSTVKYPISIKLFMSSGSALHPTAIGWSIICFAVAKAVFQLACRVVLFAVTRLPASILPFEYVFTFSRTWIPPNNAFADCSSDCAAVRIFTVNYEFWHHKSICISDYDAKKWQNVTLNYCKSRLFVVKFSIFKSMQIYPLWKNSAKSASNIQTACDYLTIKRHPSFV